MAAPVYHQNAPLKGCASIATPSWCWRCNAPKGAVQADIRAKGLKILILFVALSYW